MQVAVVVAMDENNGIGLEDKLPWYLPNDLRHFKQLTTGQTVVMGRKTYESIGKALPNRINIVLTRKQGYQAKGCIVEHSISSVIHTAFALDNDLYVIGGSEIYQIFMPLVGILYVTKIKHEFKSDAFFPQINDSEWHQVSQVQGIKDDSNAYDYYFNKYIRRKGSLINEN